MVANVVNAMESIVSTNQWSHLQEVLGLRQGQGGNPLAPKRLTAVHNPLWDACDITPVTLHHYMET